MRVWSGAETTARERESHVEAQRERTTNVGIATAPMERHKPSASPQLQMAIEWATLGGD